MKIGHLPETKFPVDLIPRIKVRRKLLYVAELLVTINARSPIYEKDYATLHNISLAFGRRQQLSPNKL